MTVDILKGSLWKGARGIYDCLSTAYSANGETRTSLGHAVAEINEALALAGEPERLTQPGSVDLAFSEWEGCPLKLTPKVRVVLGEDTESDTAAFGVFNYGQGVHRISTVSYLAQRTAETGETKERSLAEQCGLWVQAQIVALRRRDGKGVFGYSGGAVYECNLVRMYWRPYDLNESDKACAARLVCTWELTQEAYY